MKNGNYNSGELTNSGVELPLWGMIQEGHTWNLSSVL